MKAQFQSTVINRLSYRDNLHVFKAAWIKATPYYSRCACVSFAKGLSLPFVISELLGNAHCFIWKYKVGHSYPPLYVAGISDRLLSLGPAAFTPSELFC